MNVAIFYLEHLALAAVFVALFIAVYTWVTPYDEFKLIKGGNEAAAFSLGGAVLGFSLTLGSSITHNSSLLAVAAWALGALVVQVVTFVVLSRLFKGLQGALESGNRAVGITVGVLSFAIGVINAACLS